MENEWYEMNFSKYADKSYGSDTMYQQYNCPTSSYQQYNCLPNQYQQYNCLPNQYQPILNQGYPAQVCPVQAATTVPEKPACDTIIGEYIVPDILRNNMYAISGKNNKIKKRLISVGVINECKIIHYSSNGERRNYYIIKMMGSDRQKNKITLNHNEFDGNKLLDILADKGKILFVHTKKDKEECELIRKYIIGIADKDDFEYPEFTDWIKGRYIVAREVYNIETPFFKHIIRSRNMSEQEAAEGLLNNINIFLQVRHRLFFLILMHYIVIQRLVPPELRCKKPIYVRSDSDLTFVINAALGIFGDNRVISLSLPKKRIAKEMYMTKGTMAFFEIAEYGDVSLCNVSENIKYINAEMNADTTVIILCRVYNFFSDSAFNISLKEIEIQKTYVDKDACGEHIRHFADWISENNIDVSNVQADNWIELTYVLIKKYFKNCGVRLGFENTDAVVQDLFSESEYDSTGEWITEWLGENILRLKRQKKLNIIDLNADEVRFSNEKPNICKKGSLICFKENDLKFLTELCGDSKINSTIIKESLLRADALETDNNRQTYQKNIYVRAYNKSIRMIAVMYDRIFPTGHIGI